mmetsp:Transcript_14907/g.41202  ORF Transcript_14907/g.41202 Transcript_14907/m.41202 type:complete len:610 (+) Transcript_14907:65-1894(+)
MASMLGAPSGGRAPPARKTSKPFLRKPVPQEEDESDLTRRKPNCSTLNDSDLERHFSLCDLVAVGIAGTVGSGLFVLAGLVAAEYAGPASVLSWLISGLTACLSGVCYAELSARIPLPGGSYAYNYVAHGELFAVLAAACLSLEYIAASSAVARSWADKCLIWLLEELDANSWIHQWLDPSAMFSPLAGVLSAAITGLLLLGVKESKAATNFFTILKLCVTSVMIFGAMYYVRPENWSPFCPAEYGISGVVRGATGTFFGYLGYDQVTALAGEAKSSKRNLPRAIIGVLIGVMVLYMSATVFLTGMKKYTEISSVSGFPDAFRSVGANFVADFVSFGEIATLPIVILVTIMAQPRLQYAMAKDGLLPPVFAQIDCNGNLWNGTLIAGTAMTLISACVPFENLNDMISCAVLTVLALTDSSVVLLWHEGTEEHSNLPGQLMGLFHFLSLVSGVAMVNFMDNMVGRAVAASGACGMIIVCWAVSRFCPRCSTFGGSRSHYNDNELQKEDGYFRTPLVPLVPCLAIATNWYLIAQLSLSGIGFFLAFLALAVSYYFLYASHHSVGGNGGWESPSDRYSLGSERDPSYSEVSRSERSNTSSDPSSDENTPLNP